MAEKLSEEQKEEVRAIVRDEGSKLTVLEWTAGFMNRGVRVNTIAGAVFHKGWTTDQQVTEKQFADAIAEYRQIKG